MLYSSSPNSCCPFYIDPNLFHFIHIVHHLQSQIILKSNSFSLERIRCLPKFPSNMHALKSLIIIALATTVSSAYFNGELLRREVVLVARATSSSIAAGANSTSATATATTAAYTNSTNACSSVLQGLATLITGLPTPTGALSTYLATAATTLTDPCHLSVPSSVASAFSIYESSVISFYSAHSSQLNSALAACPSLTSLVANPVCSTSTAGIATPTATTTAKGTSSASSSPSSLAPVSAADANRGDKRIIVTALVVASLFGAAAVAL